MSVFEINQAAGRTKGFPVAFTRVQPVVPHGRCREHGADRSAVKTRHRMSDSLHRATTHQMQGRSNCSAAMAVPNQTDGAFTRNVTNKFCKIPAVPSCTTSQQINIQFDGWNHNWPGTRPHKVDHLQGLSTGHRSEPAVGHRCLMFGLAQCHETAVNIDTDGNIRHQRSTHIPETDISETTSTRDSRYAGTKYGWFQAKGLRRFVCRNEPVSAICCRVLHRRHGRIFTWYRRDPRCVCSADSG